MHTSRLILRVSLILFLMLLLVGSSPAMTDSSERQTNLAGAAVFPHKEYNNWLSVQLNPDIKAEEKIKNTINTYFRLKYESWLKDTLFDFGFLFDQAEAGAREDYAYERGLLYYLLTGWKYGNILLKHYEYELKFYKFEVDGEKATVEVRPNANIVQLKMPDRVDYHSWMKHMFTLVLVENRWLIQSVICDDELHTAYPHGTDFNFLAATFPDQIKAFEAEAEAEHEEKMRSDPRYKEFMESRYKTRQEELAAKGQEGEERIRHYNEIAGEYKFEELSNTISFYVKGHYLMGKWERDDEGVILQRVEREPFGFEFRPKDGKVYKLQFSRDDEGKITKCLMRTKGMEFEGMKIKR